MTDESRRRRQELSVFIITKDEEANLAECLDAARRVASEIIVLDSGSSDGTLEIARRFGAQVHFREFDGFGQQKRAAEDLCAFDWVLNLDADEFLTREAIDEINGFMATRACADEVDGARLKTVGIYPHRTAPRLWSDYHNYVRLYRRSRLRYPDHPTKDAIVAPDEAHIHQFKNHALHRSFSSLQALDDKARRRTAFYLSFDKSRSRAAAVTRAPFEFFLAFLKVYLLRRHFTGGAYGLRVSWIYAKYRTIRVLQRGLGFGLFASQKQTSGDGRSFNQAPLK